MSKIVLVCYRDKKQKIFSQGDIEILAERIRPDNISQAPPLVIDRDGLLLGIFNPHKGLLRKNTSVCLGALWGMDDRWWEPSAAIPDGSYALFRANENTIELVCDAVASRTIWYIQTERMFIAATSQRAIIFFLQSFSCNRSAFSWMLSSGSLGWGLSWDTRLSCLGGGARLILDRSSWLLTVEKKRVTFQSGELVTEKQEKEFREALNNTFENLQLDWSRWILPLSGGFDSRAILLMLRHHDDLQCVTWGLKGSLNEIGSDAYVARKLAHHFTLKHAYYETNISEEPAERILKRFLIAGEGRIDHFGGYSDGFKIWKRLYEDGISGILRGDVTFSTTPVITDRDVREAVGGTMLLDYAPVDFLKSIDLPEQVWPENLSRRNDETLISWRDRVFHEYRIPVVLAALTDLKCSFVEVANPLLSRGIIEQTRKLPDSARKDKGLFKKIVSEMSPPIEFASVASIADTSDFLENEKVAEPLRDELNSSYCRSILSNQFVDAVLKGIIISVPRSMRLRRQSKQFVRRLLPKHIRVMVRRKIIKPRLDFNQLAFRSYLISNMTRILSADAECLRKNGRGVSE